MESIRYCTKISILGIDTGIAVFWISLFLTTKRCFIKIYILILIAVRKAVDLKRIYICIIYLLYCAILSSILFPLIYLSMCCIPHNQCRAGINACQVIESVLL